MIFRVAVSFFSVLFLLSLVSPSQTPSSISPREEKIPDSIVWMDSGYAIVVDKKEQKLFVFKKEEQIHKVFAAPCSTGKNAGGKQIEGDARTPEGIFFITKVARNPGPPETYGTIALPLDYPNISDQRAGRNGTNIWIHGTTKPLVPFQSNGCVVLRDTDVQRLVNYVQLNKTPVVICESINWLLPSQRAAGKNDLDKFLADWNAAFQAGSLETLDKLYLSGMEIKNKKRDMLQRQFRDLMTFSQHFALTPRDVSILRYGNSAVILFDQITSIHKDNTFQGSYLRLTLERINNRWYAMDELPPSQIAAPIVAPVTAPVADFSADREEIRKLVVKWAASWESGNMETFRSLYASNFRSRGMTLNAWVQNKIDIRSRSQHIRVRLENIRIQPGHNTATAAFTQHYSSSILKSSGGKQLDLRKINGEWKIFREKMIR